MRQVNRAGYLLDAFRPMCSRSMMRWPMLSLRTYATYETMKKPDARKTLLVNEYTRIFRKSPIILITHNSMLPKAESEAVRNQIKAAGARLTATRSALVKVALRGLEHEDPASKEANKLYRKAEHPLMPYFRGHTAIVTIDELDPRKTAAVVKILDKMGEKMLLLGAYIDGMTMDRGTVDEFKTLPTMDELRANLAGVLSILGGAGLVQTLQATSNKLYLTLESRKEDMQGTSETSGSENN